MKTILLIVFFVFITFLTACQIKVPDASLVNVQIIHDGQSEKVQLPENLTVNQAISTVNLNLGPLDRVEPSINTLISENLIIKIIRVEEEFQNEETTLPFECQTVKNESLPAGQTILIQAGINGTQNLTYRVIYEDGVEISRTLTRTEILQPSQPEIVMVGVQSSFKSIEITGSLAYITSSNAWLMDGNTGNRRALVTTGDLDGRIFSISPDRQWLLFSRNGGDSEKDVINSLWIINLISPDSSPISLGISNVVHYADWVPGKERTITFSTVEPRSTAPGWQANNDLILISFDTNGKIIQEKTILDSNSGGIYGWWGTTYSWSPDASEIAYARPDSIGLVDSKSGTLNPILEFSPYQTQGDWAWVPGLSWSNGHNYLYSVIPFKSTQSSVKYDLVGLIFNGETSTTDLVENTGLFAYPVISQQDVQGNIFVAYLSATIPEQSETSRYALHVMDRDGSNDRKLYPDEGIQGVDPQEVVWSPSPNSDGSIWLGFIAQGNLMFVDPSNDSIQQITGDGSISRIDWK